MSLFLTHSLPLAFASCERFSHRNQNRVLNCFFFFSLMYGTFFSSLFSLCCCWCCCGGCFSSSSHCNFLVCERLSLFFIKMEQYRKEISRKRNTFSFFFVYICCNQQWHVCECEYVCSAWKQSRIFIHRAIEKVQQPTKEEEEKNKKTRKIVYHLSRWMTFYFIPFLARFDIY